MFIWIYSRRKHLNRTRSDCMILFILDWSSFSSWRTVRNTIFNAEIFIIWDTTTFCLPWVANSNVAMKENRWSIIELKRSQSETCETLFSIFEDLQSITRDFNLIAAEIFNEGIRDCILRVITKIAVKYENQAYAYLGVAQQRLSWSLKLSEADSSADLT